jgi:integrase/recombinase XerD
LTKSAELRTIARAHVIAWRKHLESRKLAAASIRRKLSALSSLFEYLCERNAIAVNPVDGEKRPVTNNNEGSAPAMGEDQAGILLGAPPPDTLKGKRDRAILATLLYHGIRRGNSASCEYATSRLAKASSTSASRARARRIRYIPAHPGAIRLIEKYLAMAKHGGELDGPLFRPVKNNRTKTLNKHLDPGSIYRNIVRKYGLATGISAEVNGLRVHSLRATAATNALSHEADIAKVQEWLGLPISPPPASTTGAKAGPTTVRRIM